MTDRRYRLQLRAGAHAELTRLADELREEAQKHLPKDRGPLAASARVTPCIFPQMAVMAAGQRVPLHAAHPSLNRIDLIVKTMTVPEDRHPRIEALLGVPATSPSPPARTSNWLRAETPLAQVRVLANQVEVTQADIFPPGVDVPFPKPAPDSSWLAMENAERLRARKQAGLGWFPLAPLSLHPSAPPAAPKREVIADSGLFTVTGWRLTTTDRVLAEAVAREFDRIDPLPADVEWRAQL